MVEHIGQRLLREKIVTEEEVQKAIDRQKIHGGRLGHNLVALGYISSEEFRSFMEQHPDTPITVGDTGLDLSFIGDLIMKHILYMGDFKLTDVADNVKLPLSIVDSAIEILRREKLVEVKRADEYTRMTYTYSITGQGKNRARDLLDICRYVGPAPVPLHQYKKMVEVQTVRNVIVNEEIVRDAFSHLIIRDALLKRLGPAISSGKAIFIYGPSGNGKTTIAETIGQLLPGEIYVPYALIIGGQIISIYDPVTHINAQDSARTDKSVVDQRWTYVKRPVVMAGGELTLKTLDLDFNTISKYYEASLQMKANNGLFVIDDFGRQQLDPQHLLNRWIVPLERRIDFMTLHTGMKFDIPFDQITIFSTNIEPRKLVDEAFLRRIRYKVKIDHPSEKEYEDIFRMVCRSNGIEFKKDILKFLLDDYYRKQGVKLNACHPRDIIDHILDDAHYYHRAPELTQEAIANAWESYFVDM